MFARPGIRIASALALVVLVLIAALVMVGTEERDGLVTRRLPAETPPRNAAITTSPSAAQRSAASPEDRGEALPYEPAPDEILIDDASGVVPSADLDPDPMLIPEGRTPEPIIGPGAASSE